MFFQRGTVTRQVHVDIPHGTVEEEYAREGFFGRTSHLYRSHPPVDWTAIDGELRPMSMDSAAIAAGTWPDQRVTLLANDDAKIGLGALDAPMEACFRNADGDEILFVHRGEGLIETDFGPLTFRAGHYLVIPRGTVYRIVPDTPTRILFIETRGEVKIPDRGLIGQHALFDPGVLEVPTPAAPADADRPWQLRIKRRDRYSTVTYPHHPITTVGWRGELTVWRLHVDDIRPIASERYHLPPTAHATFVADGVVICSFLPRPLETGDPGALKVPFYHSNIDYDEVLFYHAGQFFSREGIGAGMLTFHPQGIHHGPQPGAVDAARDKTRTDEVAVMIDTRRPLEATAAAESLANPDYWRSWGA